MKEPNHCCHEQQELESRPERGGRVTRNWDHIAETNKETEQGKGWAQLELVLH